MNEQIVMTQDGETNIWVTDVNDWFSSLASLKLECQSYTVSEMRFQEVLKEHDAKVKEEIIEDVITYVLNAYKYDSLTREQLKNILNEAKEVCR